MPRAFWVVVAAALLLSAGPHPVKATLIVNSWNLRAVVEDFDGEIEVAGGVFNQVQPSPWIDEHGGVLATSSIAAQYNFVYGGDSAVFHIDTQMHCERVLGVAPQCSASGRIDVTPTVDTIVSIDGSLAYVMNADPASINFVSEVFIPSPFELLFLEGEQAFSGLDPAQGTLAIGGSLLLPATGQTYRLRYSAYLSMSTNTALGGVMTGDGSIEFVLTPVPECAAISLLIPAFVFVARRRRGRNRRMCRAANIS